MTSPLSSLQPNKIWHYFELINAIPRASKAEDQISNYIYNFGKSLNLETERDENGNVLIKKNASIGMENKQTVILQSHVDMVHQKNSDTVFDFSVQGIDMYVDGDWVKARGTTLGADNGIGVATIMAILADSDIVHPKIEALFTTDEETGMTGAKTLKPGWLNGDILLNLDTEDDDELTIGCAGGVDVTVEGSCEVVSIGTRQCIEIFLSGLKGGHSGVEIQIGRANANKLMNRMLYHLMDQFAIGICEIKGGSLRNAIPRESMAILSIQPNDFEEIQKTIQNLEKTIASEYSYTDPDLKFSIKTIDPGPNSATDEFSLQFIRSTYASPNGIYRMTPDIEGLVQTSNNMSKIEMADGKFSVQNLTRSSVDSEKQDVTNAINCAYAPCQGKVITGGDYPGWKPNPNAPIVKIMSDLYIKLFGSEAHVNAIHAGLECGIIGANYPKMQMISFGPNIYGAHSPDERAQISSVQKFWSYLQEILKNIPDA